MTGDDGMIKGAFGQKWLDAPLYVDVDGTHKLVSPRDSFPILLILSAVSLASLCVASTAMSSGYASK